MSVESSNPNAKDTHFAHQGSGPRRTIIEISLVPNFQQSLTFCGVGLYPVETIPHYALKLWQPALRLASMGFLEAGHSDVVCDCVNDEGDNYHGNTNDIDWVRHSVRDVRRGEEPQERKRRKMRRKARIKKRWGNLTNKFSITKLKRGEVKRGD
jgi:hypothetical protein